jgi:hypothetical protein
VNREVWIVNRELPEMSFLLPSQVGVRQRTSLGETMPQRGTSWDMPGWHRVGV